MRRGTPRGLIMMISQMARRAHSRRMDLRRRTLTSWRSPLKARSELSYMYK
jgi:hypothetical protein